ncbi:MAG: serine hydrolase [Pedobacter sp.]|nr:serine hydrolase [Chitinophagaceae bacterium]
MLTKPEQFLPIITQKDSLRVQIIYTKIDRDYHNKPTFTDYTFNLNNNTYFYPASTVKMPIAFLALEKLNDLKQYGIDMNTLMVTDSNFQGQQIVYTNPTAKDSRATIANYIKQIFLVSDNDAFNRLYEFLGQAYIQQKLNSKGFTDIIIRHRLQVSLTNEQNRATNPINFYDTSGKLLYHQDGQFSNAIYPNLNVAIGKGYYKGNQLINEPFNFSEKNRVYLNDQHHILQSILFNDDMPKKQQFNINQNDQNFLKHWMSAYPRESVYPYYDTANYWDAYCKFLLFGSEKGSLPSNIRIFNKVGDAYGFLTDVAYIIDIDKKIEFMLSATILCNKDGIFNDDKYDYDTLGFPFMKNLGQLIYIYELQRKRRNIPNLHPFTINYAPE